MRQKSQDFYQFGPLTWFLDIKIYMFRCFNRFRLDNVVIRTCISNQFHIIAFSDERQTVILHARTAFNVAQYYYVRGLAILLVAQCFEHIAEKGRCQNEQR